ncbi:MAG TPA: hypothetical protein ENI30_14660 [Gammaproteobacteria bacterium]|nr:hypothetical protein [Gammaproteobacteria bacterium]
MSTCTPVGVRRFWRKRQISITAQSPCGSGLTRECGVSETHSETDTPLSRASPLPHWVRGACNYFCFSS